MKTTAYITKKITIESENFIAERWRDTNGNVSIKVKKMDGGVVYMNDVPGNYESKARELSEILDKIANNLCKITEE